jgi:hypothetical protein
MKKRKTRLTADDWKRFAEHRRELEERVAILDRKIAAKKAGRVLPE